VIVNHAGDGKALDLPEGCVLLHTPAHVVHMPEKWELQIGDKRVPLIGNRNARERREMIAAVIEAHDGPTP
jgi:hypothetical protein